MSNPERFIEQGAIIDRLKLENATIKRVLEIPRPYMKAHPLVEYYIAIDPQDGMKWAVELSHKNEDGSLRSTSASSQVDTLFLAGNGWLAMAASRRYRSTLAIAEAMEGLCSRLFALEQKFRLST
jgi:hypothetical protein